MERAELPRSRLLRQRTRTAWEAEFGGCCAALSEVIASSEGASHTFHDAVCGKQEIPRRLPRLIDCLLQMV
jgi:hypothetical protein